MKRTEVAGNRGASDTYNPQTYMEAKKDQPEITYNVFIEIEDFAGPEIPERCLHPAKPDDDPKEALVSWPHITVLFGVAGKAVGLTDAERAATAASIRADLAARAPFSVTLDGVGMWPTQHWPPGAAPPPDFVQREILFVKGDLEASPDLVFLHEYFSERFRRKWDHDTYSPHVTLGYARLGTMNELSSSLTYARRTFRISKLLLKPGRGIDAPDVLVELCGSAE